MPRTSILVRDDESPRGESLADRDIIVVGGSAGAVEVLRRLASDLPSGLPAAVFVVLHLPPSP
jgi:two-component system, chemotaxis family, protein-glutamate methylesterase/glutaminase